MLYYIAKVAISAILIVLISEISKRSSFIGALLASLPLVSVLAMIWLYIDTKNTQKVGELASSVFWLVLPSLTLFVLFPILAKQGLNFGLSLGISLVATVLVYWAMVAVLNVFGVKL